MKNLKIYLFSFFICCGLTACNNFDDLNVDPVNPTEVSPDLLFTGALRNGTLNWDIYQIGQNLHADLFVQYFSNVNPGFLTDQYISNPGWLSTFWNQTYSIYIINTQEIIRLSQSEPLQSNKTNVARIWRAWLYHRASDYWGDIPYREAGKAFDNDIRTPKYDTQEFIYKDLIKELKEASAGLDDTKAKFTASDILYKGDLTKWRKFANSLRLRLALRMSKADPATAQREVTEVMAQNQFMVSDADNALMQTQVAGQFINRNPLAILFNFDEFRISKTMTDLLKSLNDPRLTIYAAPVDNVTPAKYEGLINGLNASQLGQPQNAKAQFSKMGATIRQEGAPIDVMTYAEVSLLKAEAVLKGWGTGNANTFYEDGIRSSLSRRGVAAAAISTYLLQPNVVYNNTLERIITQKWLALFPNGFEAWAEWRRTGFPALLQIPNLGDTNGTVPRRVIYPPTEANLNAAAYQEAVARQGADRMTTRVWWDRP